MNKSLSFFLLLTVLFCSNAIAQNCVLKELKQERVDEKGNSKELLHYQFTYTSEGALENVTINETSAADGDTEHVLKFDNVDIGRKITWFWDGEYDSHYIVTKESLLEFTGDDENDLDIENADVFPLQFTNGQLTFDEDNNTTYYWNGDVIIQSIWQARKTKNTTDFTYTDVPNPFHNLVDLGFIDVSVNNFLPLIYTLPTKLLASEKVTRYKEGEKEESRRADTFSHTLTSGQCPEQFIVDKGSDKVVFTFMY